MTDPEQTTRDRHRRRGPGRRRARARPAFDATVPSPCISVCQIDEASGLCLGCLRSIDEIREWPILSAAQKTAVLGLIAGRRARDPGP